MELLRGILASLWPQKKLRWWYPEEPQMLAHGAVISGAVEFILFGYLEFTQFEKHFVANANHFASANETTTVLALAVVAIAELFYPLSLLLIVFIAEGFVRAVSAYFVGEAFPTFPLAIGVRLWLRYHRARETALPRTSQ
jgi:hypothetical protein